LFFSFFWKEGREKEGRKEGARKGGVISSSFVFYLTLAFIWDMGHPAPNPFSLLF